MIEDSPQALQTPLELVFQVRQVLYNLIIGPLSTLKRCDKGEKFACEHGWNIAGRCDGEEVLQNVSRRSKVCEKISLEA